MNNKQNIKDKIFVLVFWLLVIVFTFWFWSKLIGLFI